MGCSKKTTIFVIGGILVVVALAVGLGVGLSGGSNDDGNDDVDVKPKVSIPDYLSGKFTGKSFNFNFVSSEVQNAEGTLVYSSNDDSDINIDQFSAEANDFIFSKSLAKNTKFQGQTWFKYSVSPDQKYILFGYDRRKLWRSVSYNATYQLYDVESQQYIESAWSKTPVSACDSNNSDNPEIQYISWAPKGHSLVMVCHYNIWYTSDPTTSMVQVQDNLDGLENQIYNGIPEWAYEEEMLGSNNAIYWSPEGTKFLWVKFVTQTYADAQKGSINDHLYLYSWYGDGTNQYPETKAISFAKAGTTPSSNELFVFDTVTSKSTSLKSMQPFESNVELPYGLWSRCDWLNENSFVGIWQNRIQSSSESVFFTFDNNWTRQDSGKVTEFTEKTGWVGSFGPWWPFYDLKDSYFTIRTKKVDETFAKLGARADAEIQEGFWTVARVDRMSDDITYLSDHQASYTDTDLIHYDSVNDILWFYAAAPLPRHRQIHFVRDASKATTAVAPTCATCKLYDEHPNACGQALINTVGNNQDSSHVFIKCAGGVDVPMYFYKTYKDFMNPDSSWALMEDNSQLKSDIEKVSMPTKEYGTMESKNWPDKDYHFQLFKPENFDENKKYPLLIEVYAGPEFQKVEDRWSVDFCRSMASEYDLVCASVDGRGSAFEGDRFMQQVYLKLGQTECVDQTEFGKFMLNLINF